MMFKKILLIVIAFLFLVGWSNDPNVNTPVCTSSGEQDDPHIVSDGYGGAIITWQDKRFGNKDIFAQYFDAAGTRQWKKNGIAICVAQGSQESPQITADGSGGAIIAWEDNRNGNHYDIYAQKIDASGAVLWTPGGVAICRAAGDQEIPRVVSDGSGGAIIAWRDQRSGRGDVDFYAQRINAAGNVCWTTNGIGVCTVHDVICNCPECIFLQMISDGSGGAILVWEDSRDAHHIYDIYAQRINGAGSNYWTADGIQVASNEGKSISRYIPELTTDRSGGAFIFWDFYMNSTREQGIQGQHISAAGTRLWAAEGATICSNDWYGSSFQNLNVISDRRAGAIISFDYHVNCVSPCYNTTISCTQRVDRSANILWGGRNVEYYGLVVVDSTIGYQRDVQLTSDGAGGAIFSWQDFREENEDGEIYAQHVSASGERNWTPRGIAVSIRSGEQETPQLVSDGAGGAIVTWQDGDIYAQKVCDNGGLGDCVLPVAVINADRYGGMAPLTIQLDAGESFDPDGSLKSWNWDFDDGSTSTKEKVTHTFQDAGKYRIEMQVKDNDGRWSTSATAWVFVYSPGDFQAELSLEPVIVKARNKGKVQVKAVCREVQTDPDHEERPIPVDLGLELKSTIGSWVGDLSFNSGFYNWLLESDSEGTATVTAELEGNVLASGTVFFAWPKPPQNITVEIQENRSLFRGEMFANISWSPTLGEQFTPSKYRIYRWANNGNHQLIAELDANTLSYLDTNMIVGNQYGYAVTMVDSEGDESDEGLATYL